MNDVIVTQITTTHVPVIKSPKRDHTSDTNHYISLQDLILPNYQNEIM